MLPRIAFIVFAMFLVSVSLRSVGVSSSDDALAGESVRMFCADFLAATGAPWLLEVNPDQNHCHSEKVRRTESRRRGRSYDTRHEQNEKAALDTSDDVSNAAHEGPPSPSSQHYRNRTAIPKRLSNSNTVGVACQGAPGARGTEIPDPLPLRFLVARIVHPALTVGHGRRANKNVLPYSTATTLSPGLLAREMKARSVLSTISRLLFLSDVRLASRYYWQRFRPL